MGTSVGLDIYFVPARSKTLNIHDFRHGEIIRMHSVGFETETYYTEGALPTENQD